MWIKFRVFALAMFYICLIRFVMAIFFLFYDLNLPGSTVIFGNN